MGERREVLQRYVPALVRRRLLAGEEAEPRADRVEGAVLFADIKGSTALAERLAERGAGGAEELSRILNSFFGDLIETLLAHGGDVVKFAGDGVFAFWSAAPDSLPTAALAACGAGLAAQAQLQRAAAHREDRLSMRIGIGIGECRALALGRANQRLDFLLVGAPVAQACEAERAAGAGEVHASVATWAAIRSSAEGEATPSGAVRVRAIAGDPAPRAVVPDENGGAAADVGLVQRLRAFAPPALLPRLEADHGEWLAELRRITALFLQLPDWSNVELEEAQATLAIVHAVLDRCGGQLLRLGMDARRPVVKAAFGVPPRAHEDDAGRAVQAALEMRQELARRAIRVSIGIATGRVFCGDVGNDHRREYTTTGEVVHRAARLMQHADGEVLCDESTRFACGEKVEFDAIPPLTLKGIATPVGAFQPRGRKRSTTPPSQRTIIGRTAERARLFARITQGADSDRHVTVVEGEAGLGKSRLVTEVLAAAEANGVATLVGAGDAIEASTPYHAWRPILAKLIHGKDGDESAPPTLAAVRNALVALGDEPLAGATPASLAPLLLTILGGDSDDDEITARITGEARIDVTHELIIRLLQRAAAAGPLLLVIEDAHWLDSASWAVLEPMAARVRRLQTLVATRPVQESSQPAFQRLLRAEAVEVIRLGFLDENETASLVADRLGVRSVSPPILDFIHARAGGHPFFTEELTYALRDTGVLHRSGDECRLSPRAGDLGTMDLPQTVELTLTSRMAVLEARQQLLLKVASVFGQTFSGDALRDLYPLDTERHHLDGDLALLQERDLIHRRGTDAFAFKHAITRDVAYAHLSFAQRRQLHRRVAEWYEQVHASDLRGFYPLLAHHWSRAVDVDSPDASTCTRAVETLERAGEQAVASYANGEAVQLLQEALRLHALLPQEEGARRRARWLRHLADANNRLGKIPEAIEHALAALEHLDQPFPRGNARCYAGIARQLGRQMRHRFAGVGRRLSGSAREEALDAAHLYELLGLMWYVTLDGVPATLANLRAINLAERAGPSPELATSSAMIGLSAGVLLGPKYSEHYFRAGTSAARETGDRYGHGRVCYTRALVHTGAANWREADAAYAEALATFSEIGEARWRDIVRIQLASTAFLRRRYGDSRRLYEEAAASPRERGDVQAQAWVSIGRATCLVIEGRMAESLDAWEQLTSWLANNMGHLADRGSELVILGARALACYRLQRIDDALAAIESSQRLVRESPALTCYTLPGYMQTAETCLRLWECGDVPVDRIEPMAREAVANLQRYARLYRLGQPALALWSGTLDWLRARHTRAVKAWNRALVQAQQLDLAHEAGLAHYELGRHSADAAERRAHLDSARARFMTAGLPLEYADAERAASSR